MLFRHFAFLEIVAKHFSHGIGLATVKHLVRRGATVYLGSRNEERGKAAVAEVEREFTTAVSGNDQPKPGKVIYQHCELSSPALAKASAEEFMQREERLDVLSKCNISPTF